MAEDDWRQKLIAGMVTVYLALWLAIIVQPLIPTLGYDPAQYSTLAERDEARDDQGIYAQIWMAWAAWAQVITGLVGLIGLGITIYFARKAWQESREAAVQAKRSADTAERQLADADRGRAHIEIDSTVSFREARHWREGGDIATVSIEIKNVGTRFIVLRTMRVDFLPVVESFPYDNEPKPPVTFLRRGGPPSIMEPILLAPGQARTIEGSDSRPLPSDYLEVGFWILGRIRYTDHLEILREAGFCYRWAYWGDELPEDGFTMYRWTYDRRLDQSDG